jgi:diacylglycerol O-acyltransferase / trehalose O-mycolyltransferase
MERMSVAALWLIVAAVIVSGCGSREPTAREPGTSSDGVEVRRTGRRQLDLRIASEAVGRDVSVRILLPARYEQEPERRWPVLYLLHDAATATRAGRGRRTSRRSAGATTSWW